MSFSSGHSYTARPPPPVPSRATAASGSTSPALTSVTDDDYLNEDLLGDGSPPPSYSAPRPPNRPPNRPPSRPPPSLISDSEAEPSLLSPASEVGDETDSASGSGRLVIAIDYGTTFTGVSWTTTHSDHADLGQIKVLTDWTTRMSNQQKVRSVISYALAAQEWGSDISEEAITMVNTKLELEPRDTRFDELDLTLHVLRGTGFLGFEHIRKSGPNPAFTARTPVQIVTDYLTKVWECARAAIKIDQLAVTKKPVDIVITVPVDWSYQAYDSIFKAVRAAGFNKDNIPTLKDTILVTEPEAASYFTARDLQARGTEFLKQDDCFVLCDAGGGTVDAISYQVKTVQPFLQLERATTPTGDKCGSSLIDTEFKRWLREAIGRERYAEIDPVNAKQQRISPNTAETGVMRDIIRRFNVGKETFSNKQQDIKVDLPPPLNGLTIEGRVKEGELTIRWLEMKAIMNTCVNGVIKLIRAQVEKVGDGKGRRVKNLLLVGGFGASPYLQEELEKSMKRKFIKLHRPASNKSLTAVVQGGVIYGVEKSRHKHVKYMAATTKSYGILLEQGRFEWPIKKGDLILSNQETTIWSRYFWHQSQSCIKGKYDFPVYFCLNDDDYLPEWWKTGQHEVESTAVVKADLSGYLDRDLRPHPHNLIPGRTARSNSRSSIGPLRWRFTLSATSIQAELHLKDARIGQCEIKVECDRPADHSSANEMWHDLDD